jgi:hypothetical protein
MEWKSEERKYFLETVSSTYLQMVNYYLVWY